MNDKDIKLFETMCVSTKCINCEKIPKCFGYCNDHCDKTKISKFLLKLMNINTFVNRMTAYMTL